MGLSKHFTDAYNCAGLATYLEVRDDFVEEIQRSQPDNRSNYPAIANEILKCWNRDIAAGLSVEERLSKLEGVLKEDLERPDLATKCSNFWQVRKMSW